MIQGILYGLVSLLSLILNFIALSTGNSELTLWVFRIGSSIAGFTNLVSACILYYTEYQMKVRKYDTFDDKSQDDTPLTQKLSFNDVLVQPKLTNYFEKYLIQAFAVENLYFYLVCQQIKKCRRKHKRRRLLQLLEHSYLLPYSEFEVNIMGSTRTELLKALYTQPFDPSCLDTALEEVLDLMETDQFPRFLHSDLGQLAMKDHTQNIIP